MRIKLQNDWRNTTIFLFILLMMLSLFSSRALLSLGVAGFVLSAFFHTGIRQQLRDFLTVPLLWGMTILFFVPFVSGLWSEDLASWMKVIRVKLPFLVLPLAFAGRWQLSARQWIYIAGLFLLLVLSGTVWSIWQYAMDSAAIHEAYLKAKTIPVPLEGDHVRFSWLVTVAVIVVAMLLATAAGRKQKILLSILAAWFIVYLHILAARTGLFTCYLFLIAFLVYRLFNNNRKLSFIVIGTLLLVPAAAWFLFPTFQNRFKYLRYDFDFVKNSSYLPGATDGSRLFSFKAGWQILKDHPLGVGAGDLRRTTNDWYDKNIPGMADTDKIYPSNEWLIYAGFAGWPGLLLFSFVMLLPFWTKISKQRFYWYCFHGTAVFSFLVDTGLEVQFGVFLYSFITVCWWKWLQSENK